MAVSSGSEAAFLSKSDIQYLLACAAKNIVCYQLINQIGGCARSRLAEQDSRVLPSIQITSAYLATETVLQRSVCPGFVMSFFRSSSWGMLGGADV